MKAAIAAAALLVTTVSAHAMSDEYVAAFVQASHTPSERTNAVLAEMNEFRSLESMAKSGVLKSPYDCLPEFRAFCFDVLAGVEKGDENTTIQEWGEWADAFHNDKDAQKAFVQQHVDEAAKRGFNLLTNAELEAALKD